MILKAHWNYPILTLPPSRDFFPLACIPKMGTERLSLVTVARLSPVCTVFPVFARFVLGGIRLTPYSSKNFSHHIRNGNGSNIFFFYPSFPISAARCHRSILDGERTFLSASFLTQRCKMHLGRHRQERLRHTLFSTDKIFFLSWPASGVIKSG